MFQQPFAVAGVITVGYVPLPTVVVVELVGRDILAVMVGMKKTCIYLHGANSRNFTLVSIDSYIELTQKLAIKNYYK